MRPNTLYELTRIYWLLTLEYVDPYFIKRLDLIIYNDDPNYATKEG